QLFEKFSRNNSKINRGKPFLGCRNSKARIMTFRMASVLIIASLLFCRNVNAQPGRPNVHIGLIYPISTNGIYAGECSNHLSLHGIAGYSESELAFAGAGVTNL